MYCNEVCTWWRQTCRSALYLYYASTLCLAFYYVFRWVRVNSSSWKYHYSFLNVLLSDGILTLRLRWSRFYLEDVRITKIKELRYENVNYMVTVRWVVCEYVNTKTLYWFMEIEIYIKTSSRGSVAVRVGFLLRDPTPLYF